MHEIFAWVLGVIAGGAVSLGGGRLVVWRFYRWTIRLLATERQKAAERQGNEPPVYNEDLEPNRSSHITGHLERAIFTAVVILAPPEAAFVAMGGWLGLKMAATWGKAAWPGIPSELWDRHAFLALQAGVLSMAFAGAGGAVAIYIHYLLRCLY